jgi:general secretion pathway protein K
MTRRRGGRRRADGRRGFALVVVLLAMTLVGVVVAEFALSMRLEAAAVRATKEMVLANHLVDTAINQAIREIAADATLVGLGDDGILTFYTAERAALPRLEREKVEFGPGRYTYRISDEEARLNLNTTAVALQERLLRDLGVDKQERDTILGSIQDWRDPNDEHRLNGAESEDTYLKLKVPYRARNGNLESVAELLQIKGITRDLFHGAEGRPGLVDLVTVKGGTLVNINTAPPRVLRALGLADAEVEQIVQARRTAPYATLPGQFGGRGLGIATRTFRIEAEGLIGDRVVSRATAVVQRHADPNEPTVVFLEWSGFR